MSVPELAESTRIPGNTCPHCNAKIDAASDPLEDKKPKPGDISLCMYCGEWTVFDADLKSRKPTDEEYAIIVSIPDARKIRTAWVAMQRAKGTPSITCPHCGAVSYHLKDIEQGYCGRCKRFHAPLASR